jgi:GxxExxY protein
MNVHAALLQHQDLTQKIIGCAYRVYKKLGFGFLESVYQNALLIELSREGLSATAGEPIQVLYDGEVIGIFEADVLVEKLVLLELKAVRSLVPAHEVQLVNYLTATGIDIGLVINFGESRVEVKRKFRTPRPSEIGKVAGSPDDPASFRTNPVNPVQNQS